MKIAIYSPYLDTFGGGERYMMTIAEVFSRDHTVTVFLDRHLNSLGGDYLINELSKRFSLNLQKVNFIEAPVGKGTTILGRSIFLKKYDVLFYLTDGSIFYPTSRKNILHIQSPLVGQPARSIWGRYKLKGWDLIIYNSGFTKMHSVKNWPIQSEIIYPPVDTDKIKPLEKKKYILSVGRFSLTKKHEIMIRVYKELFKAGLINGWSLHLVGSAGKGDQDYLGKLQDLAKGLPVRFYPNLSYAKLTALYGESSIYWHAAGFGETDPTKMEHFGIATVEAMAAGCVPVVIGKGGQVEIIEDKISGYLWETLENLKQLTINLASDIKLRQKISKEAENRSNEFSKEKFVSHLIDLV